MRDNTKYYKYETPIPGISEYLLKQVTCKMGDKTKTYIIQHYKGDTKKITRTNSYNMIRDLEAYNTYSCVYLAHFMDEWKIVRTIASKEGIRSFTYSLCRCNDIYKQSIPALAYIKKPYYLVASNKRLLLFNMDRFEVEYEFDIPRTLEVFYKVTEPDDLLDDEDFDESGSSYDEDFDEAPTYDDEDFDYEDDDLDFDDEMVDDEDFDDDDYDLELGDDIIDDEDFDYEDDQLYDLVEEVKAKIDEIINPPSRKRRPFNY